MAIEIIRLSPTTDICPFHCTDKDLNDFLFEDAKKYLSDLMAVTYLLVDTDSNKTIAYFSLLNDKVAYNPLDKTIWNHINRLISNRKRRKSYPSIKIGRLAVSEECVQSGIGTTILNYIKNKVIMVPLAGCRFLTVDAYAFLHDSKSQAEYERAHRYARQEMGKYVDAVHRFGSSLVCKRPSNSDNDSSGV